MQSLLKRNTMYNVWYIEFTWATYIISYDSIDLLWKSWTSCRCFMRYYCMLQQVEEPCLPLMLYIYKDATTTSMLPLCAVPCIHQHTLIYPVSLPHNLALLPSPQYVRLVVETEAICSALYRAPLLSWKGGGYNALGGLVRGHISELCWFGSVSHSVLYHPPHNR